MKELLRKIFKQKKEEIWQQLSKEIGAEYIENGIWKENKVVARVKNWTITLDTYTVSTGTIFSTDTRIRAPFHQTDAFRFKIYRKNLFSKFGRYLGIRGIEVGYPDFERNFVIKGNDESKVRSLFTNEKIRMLIQQQPEILFQIKDNHGWFGSNFPKGVAELYFQASGIITELNRLKSLFELFSETLNQLCFIGSASENDPGIVI